MLLGFAGHPNDLPKRSRNFRFKRGRTSGFIRGSVCVLTHVVQIRRPASSWPRHICRLFGADDQASLLTTYRPTRSCSTRQTEHRVTAYLLVAAAMLQSGRARCYGYGVRGFPASQVADQHRRNSGLDCYDAAAL